MADMGRPGYGFARERHPKSRRAFKPEKLPKSVILSAAKNPSGFTPLGGESDDPTGFLAALRMTNRV
jgi:hypothetical protein